MQQTVTSEDIEVVQTIWGDHFKESFPPSQYAGWLRLYPPAPKISTRIERLRRARQ